MQQPKPFYRTLTDSFYVQLDRRQIILGADEAEADRRWHLFMADADESVIEAMNRSAKPLDKPERITVRQFIKSYLSWQDGQPKLSERSKQ